eukprot:TRINITY_DN8006_c0_g1_i1.p1 TRINITY_DN8006_c0_g1~~TRINITY_DN8006_c0_g1_i1.p1  ORF type:complete len:347 (+),score=71.99 TRINITY_DN8006_c0_g1_i1:38-1078(+)
MAAASGDVMRTLFLLAVIFLVSSHVEEEDDEIVIVEDVAVDDVPPRIIDPQNDRKHNSGSSGRKKDKHGTRKPNRSTKTTPSEVFKMVENNLKKVEKTMSKFSPIEDGDVVVKAVEEMDKDWSRFEIHRNAAIANYTQDANLHKEMYTKAEEIYTLHDKLTKIFQAQVMMHHTMMKSALEVIGNSAKYKNLRKYAKARLKSKNPARMLSSKENIVEFINVIEKKRGAKLWGLSDNEMLQFIGFAILPFISQMVLRWIVFKYLDIEGSTATDTVCALAPPFVSAAYVSMKAGIFFLSTTNLTAILATASILSFVLLGFSRTVTSSSLFSKHLTNAERIKRQMHKKSN